MISEKLIKALVKKAEFDARVLFEVVKHIQNNYDRDNNKTFHFLEMLVDPKSIVTEKDIDIEFIKDTISDYIYNPEDKDIRNVSIDKIDNIDCNIYINYEYAFKGSDMDNADSWHKNSFTLSFIDYPKVLKNS